MYQQPPIGQLLKQLHDAIERQANNTLREKDLTLVQVWVLLSLSRQEDKTYSLKELEHILDVAQSTCAGIVNRLAMKKLVVCSVDPKDKRMKLVRITPAGEACCEEAHSHMNAMEKKMFYGLSSAELETLYALLCRVYENLK